MSRFSEAIAQLEQRSEPFLTYYDPLASERTELSGTTAANWVSKTANLLIDGWDAEPEQSVRLALPTHWATMVWALAAWRVGLCITDEPADFAVVGPDRTDAASEETVFALSLRPMGLPFVTTPAGVIDYNAEVLSFGDDFFALDEPDEDAVAVRLSGHETSHADLHGTANPERLLVTPGELARDIATLAAAIVGGGSLVIVANADPEDLRRIAADEHISN